MITITNLVLLSEIRISAEIYKNTKTQKKSLTHTIVIIIIFTAFNRTFFLKTTYFQNATTP